MQVTTYFVIFVNALQAVHRTGGKENIGSFIRTVTSCRSQAVPLSLEPHVGETVTEAAGTSTARPGCPADPQPAAVRSTAG